MKYISKYITIEDCRYPKQLRELIDAPKKLYYRGNIDLLMESGIAIIGTRNMTSYGEKFTRKFTNEIALRDITVISGMALGVDTAAHKETLKVGGKTIAVLGSGLGQIYPKENVELYNSIIENDGLVISEYEDSKRPESKNFPRRNRIVAGLAECVLITEAGYRSGTSITAKMAWENNKNVYAIPGRLDSKYGVGVNKLIKAGAKIVTDINDILLDFPRWKARKKRINKYNSNIKKEYRKIYNVLSDVPMCVDEISEKTNNDVICTSKLLVLMEMEDLIEEIEGGFLKKKIKEY